MYLVVQVSEGRWVVEMSKPGRWLTVLDMKQWFHIPTQWVASSVTVDPCKHGWLAMSQRGQLVPTVVEALTRRGRQRLIATYRHK